MSDCANDAVRDELPELLYGRLTAARRAAVEAHVATCAACAGELAILREVRQALAAVPAVDVAAIVRALPRPTAGAAVVSLPAHRRWRATTVLPLAAAAVAALAVALPFLRGTVDVRPVPTGGVAATGVPAIAGRDLSSEELVALIEDVESVEALPSAEPEPLLVDLGEGGL
ncbi:MAG TPA: zf-HC2 domain-containing protein [Gemmatimonadaceae bacterium]|nr:zf-HC2 domain-containing protein [Gemmatimonadaceae bacterium]